MSIPFKSAGLLDAIARFEDKLCLMATERAGLLIPLREVDEWLNIVDEINTLLAKETAITPTFDPFIPLAQQCDTMIQNASLPAPAHFVADPFIAVIKHFLPPSKTSKLNFMPKTKPTNPGRQIAMMTPGPHSKRLNDLERLTTAAATALGPHAPPDMVLEPAAPKVTQKRKLESAELETDKEAPSAKSRKGKGKERIKVKSTEFVQSDEGGEAPATKEKGKTVEWVEIDEAPAVKKKKEAKRAQGEEDDDEYDDEEDAPKGKKRPPQLYNLTPAKEGQLKKNLVLRFPSDPTQPIVWDSATLQQAIDDEEFDLPKATDRYVKEAQQLEKDEKDAGASRKKGGKGGKRGPFYWGPHDELDFDGPVSFEHAYDPEKNPIDKNGIRRYLVADVFATPCTRCTAMAKPCFYAGGEPTPLGMCAIDEQELNKACAPCKESHHKCLGHSRLRQRTIIDNPFYLDGLLYKDAKKTTTKPKAAPKATAPKDATPKPVAPKTAATTPAPKHAAPIPAAPKPAVPKPEAVNVAGPLKPKVKDSTPKAKSKTQPSIASPSDSAPTEIARMEDRIIALEKQCKRLAAQVEETREKLDGVIEERKEDVAELLVKLKKMEQSVTSTKDWTTQKVIFAMESLFLLGNGIHKALLDLVAKMTNLPEEMGALVSVESDDSVAKVKELLERAKPKWEEMIQVLQAQLPGAQDFQRGQSTSPPTDAGPRLPGAANVIDLAPTVADATLRLPAAAHAIDTAPTIAPSTAAPTIAPSTAAPASPAPLQLQSPIAAAEQQSVVATATAGVAPAAPSSPTAPNTEGVELAPVEDGPGSPLTAIPSRPASPQSGDEQNTSTGRKRKADEEVNADITKKKPASNWKKGPLSAPHRKQPMRGRSKALDNGNPATPGESSKTDTIIEEDL